MDAHNFFTSGWVHPPKVMVLPDSNLIILGKVNHSKSLREPPLRNWILGKSSGEIVTAHCNCMAGRGEVCSHVGAVLFAIEYGVKLRDTATCTGKANGWLPPTLKNVPYLPIEKIDFSSKNAKKKKLDATVDNSTETVMMKKSAVPASKIATKPPAAKIRAFLQDIFDVTQDVAVFRVLPEFCSEVGYSPDPELPLPLTKLLFDINCSHLSYGELRVRCEEKFKTILVTEDTASLIEKKTINQAASGEWFLQRAGRITASNMKAVCRNNPVNPASSLIKKICYPDRTFRCKATNWGCMHEQDARQRYERHMIDTHEAAIVSGSGFQISPKYPFIGASPDGKIECACCGGGIIEIKCPYCFKNSTIEDLAQDKKSCLVNVNGETALDKTHAYYYQVQTQLAVCKADYCDFVLWTEKECLIERIVPDEQFQEDMFETATNFFKSAILPELIAKFFTSNKDSVLQPILATNGNVICYCQEIEREPILICMNKSCRYLKFHWDCLKIKVKPRVKQWFCPDCKKLQPKKQKVKCSQPAANHQSQS